MRKPVRKKRKPATEPTRPEFCEECKRVTTTPGGVCGPCVLHLRAKEAAPAAPPPPPPELEPKQVFIGAHSGCFRCGVVGQGLVCGGCTFELHGIPRREGDPILKYPKPLSDAGRLSKTENIPSHPRHIPPRRPHGRIEAGV